MAQLRERQSTLDFQYLPETPAMLGSSQEALTFAIYMHPPVQNHSSVAPLAWVCRGGAEAVGVEDPNMARFAGVVGEKNLTALVPAPRWVTGNREGLLDED
jgi:hypothetical protein